MARSRSKRNPTTNRRAISNDHWRRIPVLVSRADCLGRSTWPACKELPSPPRCAHACCHVPSESPRNAFRRVRRLLVLALPSRHTNPQTACAGWRSCCLLRSWLSWRTPAPALQIKRSADEIPSSSRAPATSWVSHPKRRAREQRGRTSFDHRVSWTQDDANEGAHWKRRVYVSVHGAMSMRSNILRLTHQEVYDCRQAPTIREECGAALHHRLKSSSRRRRQPDNGTRPSPLWSSTIANRT